MMNQLMIPENYANSIDVVFDEDKRMAMLQKGDQENGFYLFSIDLLKLLVACMDGNSAGKTQCQAMVQCSELCKLLVFQMETRPLFVPAKMQRVLLEFLKDAFVETPDFHTNKAQQLDVWNMIEQRLKWALTEPELASKPSKSVLIAGLLPLMISIVNSTEDKQEHLGWIFEDQERLKQMKNLLTETWTKVSERAPSFQPIAAEAIMNMETLWDISAFDMTTLNHINVSLNHEAKEDTSVKKTLLEDGLEDMTRLRRDLSNNCDFHDHKNFFNLILVEKLTINLLRAPHWSVVGETLRHMACLDDNDQKQAARMVLMLKAIRQILHKGQKVDDDDFSSQLSMMQKEKLERQRLKYLQKVIAMLDPFYVHTKKHSKYPILPQACSHGLSSKNDELVKTTMRLMQYLLMWGATEVQDCLYCYFSETKDPSMLETFQKRIRRGKAELEHALQLNLDIEADGVYSQGGSFVMDVLVVIQNLCENHHSAMQNFMRDPGTDDDQRGLNIIAELMKFLSSLDAHLRRPSAHFACQLAEQLFDTTTELVQGPCIENQAAFANSTLCQTACRILDYVNDLKFSNPAMENLAGAVVQSLNAMTEGPDSQRSKIVNTMVQSLDQNVMLNLLARYFVLFYSPGSVRRTEDEEKYRRLCFDLFILIRTIAHFNLTWTATLEAWGRDSQDVPINRHWYFEDNTGTVEIRRGNHVESVRFPIPEECSYLRETRRGLQERKRMFNSIHPGLSGEERLTRFLKECRRLSNVMLYQYRISQSGFVGMIASRFSLLGALTLVLSIAINIVMLFFYTSERYATGYINEDDVTIDDNVNSLLLVMGGFLTATSLFLFISYWSASGVPNLQTAWENQNDARWDDLVFTAPDYMQLTVLLFKDIWWVYHLLYFVVSVLGLVWSRFFFSIHLVDLVARSYALQQALKALVHRARTILMSFVLIMCLVYFYSVVGFLYFRSAYFYEERYLCENLMMCFITTVNYGLRSPGGIGDLLLTPRWDDGNYWTRFIFDFTFFLVVLILALNLILGIIIDTFAELRQLQDTRYREMKEKCFICNIHRSKFERLEATGFSTHTLSDHNMWNYVFFIFHVRRKHNYNEIDFTGPESHVYQHLTKGTIEFLPLGYAMCLDGGDDDGVIARERIDAIETACTEFAGFQVLTLAKLHRRLNIVIDELRRFQRKSQTQHC